MNNSRIISSSLDEHTYNNMLTILRAAADHFLKEPNATPHNEQSYVARDLKIVYILCNAQHDNMLFYVESKLYPGRTMVLVCSRGDTVARAKALILHILSDISHKADHFFRLKYHGEFLKDALSLQDYGIDDMSVVKMIPLNHHSPMSDAINQPVDQPDNEISTALSNEKLKFSQRSYLLHMLQVLAWLQLLSVIGNFVTVFWWAGLWVGLITLAAKYMMPVYLHIGGSVGRMSKGDRRFMLVYSFLLILVAIGDLTLLISVIRIIIAQCDAGSDYYNEYAARECSYRVWFAAVFLPVQLLMVTAAAIVCILLYYNFKFEAGQLVEGCLVQTRDVSKVLQSVVHGNARQQNNAAFELVNLSVTDDNNKFRIVEEGGLQVMLTLLTSGDTNEDTKDYAAEVLAELLTLETIQEQFIELGGLQTLCALLRSSRERVVYEVSCALSFIASSYDQHKSKIVDNNGLDDLFYPIEHGCTVEVAELLSGILLDLCLHANSSTVIANHPDTVTVMASLMAMGGALCQSVLQSLELLIIGNDKLLDPILLDKIIAITLHHRPLDQQCALLASKILSCYANNEEGAGLLASHDHLMEALMSLLEVDVSDVIETVVVIVTLLSHHQQLRLQLDEMGVLQLKSKLNTARQRFR